MVLNAEEKEKSNISEFSVHYKAKHLQTVNSEEGESTEESSNIAGNGDGGLDGGCFVPFKKKLSFGAFDELMLLQPSKRFHFSPVESDLVDDQSFLDCLV